MAPEVARAISVTGESLSISTIIAAIMGWLPAIAALFSIGWYAVLFYDRFKRRKNSQHRRREEKVI